MKISLGLFSPTIVTVTSQTIAQGHWRLDAQYYGMSDRRTRIADKGIHFKRLDECCKEIYEVPPFVHIYVDPQAGVPFYTSSALFQSDLKPSHYLSPVMKNLETYRIHVGQILMARSGDVSGGIMGSIMMVGKQLDQSTTSDHVIRFTPEPSVVNPAYLCAYLMSDFCRNDLVRNASGSVIPAIRPAALKDIEIPILSTELQRQVGESIIFANENKETSRVLLSKAIENVRIANHLKELTEDSVRLLDPEGKIQTILITSRDIIRNNHSGSEYRLDAHFYNPMAQLAIENIKKAKTEVKTIENVTERVFMCNRFKRTYVDNDHGVPFLSGKNIIQIRPTDLKYVSVSETKGIDELKLQQGWTLITRSGTLGRTCLVWKNYENYTATEHIIRVIPNGNQVDPGYLYAFLSSQYGKLQILRSRHGSVIDEITGKQIGKVLIPMPSEDEQKQIGDQVRSAYEKRAEAIRLEDEAQEILMKALTQ